MNNATSEDYLRDQDQEEQNKPVCGVDAKNHSNYSNGIHYEPATGCWVDGHWGIYGITRLVEIAQDFGFAISDLDESAVWAYKNNEELFQDE